MPKTRTSKAPKSKERLSENSIDTLYRQHATQVLATLVRLLGDIDLAEEAMHEAFATAVEVWPKQGVPEKPVAWLISTGRFKAIDRLRRLKRLGELTPELLRTMDDIEEHNVALAERDIEDDQLAFIFACCHPALDVQIQIPLTLREVCGLTTEEVASAFLVSPSAMAQRIVRGKAKIRHAKIPFAIPEAPELDERLDSVLLVIYLIFNEGYAATQGDSLTRTDLSREAIRLARLVSSLVPDPEVTGLLALMLLHESRRIARTDSEGDIVLLEKQDRSQWNPSLMQEGLALVRQALASKRLGTYTVQAAIAAVHAEAKTSDATDWAQIVALYNILLQIEPSPVVELNRAVAIAMRDGPEAGLKLIDDILQRGELQNYQLCHSARGELLKRLGRFEQARSAFEHALSLSKQVPEQRILRKKIASLPT